MEWTAEQIVAGYSGQQQVEQVFRGLKDGDWLGWGPMYRWTDSKIRVHALLLHAGYFLAQVHPQTISVRLARAHHGTTARGVAADPAVRPSLPTARRDRSTTRRCRPIQTNFSPTTAG